jgi:hypothetical protein
MLDSDARAADPGGPGLDDDGLPVEDRRSERDVGLGELLDGEPLNGRLAKGSLPAGEAIQIVLGVLAADEGRIGIGLSEHRHQLLELRS